MSNGYLNEGLFPMSPEALLSYVQKFEPDAKEVLFDCGHTERHGGNVADPSCEMASIAGVMGFATKDGICAHCKEKLGMP